MADTTRVNRLACVCVCVWGGGGGGEGGGWVMLGKFLQILKLFTKKLEGYDYKLEIGCHYNHIILSGMH